MSEEENISRMEQRLHKLERDASRASLPRSSSMSRTSVLRTARSSTTNMRVKSDVHFDYSNKYRITKKFVRKDDIESQLAGMAVTTGIVMANANVVSCLETNRETLVGRYSQDFSNILLGHTDGVVRTFDSLNLKSLNDLTDGDVFNKGPVTGITYRQPYRDFQGNSNIISTYSCGFVKCWNQDTAENIFTINENRQVLNASYHPRTSKFFTVGSDGTILMYEENSRTLERIFKSNDQNEIDGHMSKVFAIAVSPTSNYEFITGGWDDIICFWDIRQLGAIRHISGPHICGDGLDISPDGREVISCSWQVENQVSIWDYASGKLLRTQKALDTDDCRLYCGGFVSPKYFAAGGCNPNLFKVCTRDNLETAASMNGFTGPIYSFDVGDPAWKRDKIKSPLVEVPRLLITAGYRIYQVDFPGT